MPIKVISVHFPKSGGVSLLQSFRSAYGEHAVLNDDTDDPADPCGWFSMDPEGCISATRERAFPEHVEVIHGHFHIAKYMHISGAARITFLRHPVDNLISIHYFWKTLPDSHCLFRYARDNHLDVLGIARLPALRYLLSRTYFGGVDMNMFDFIGSKEKYAESLKALSDVLEKPLVEAVANVTSHPQYREEVERIKSDSALLAKLRAYLSDDIRFYERYARI